ncbi:MAG: hypothetical protein OXF03_04215 [Gammaproteobacteria bacterium]|nr:hypothetical protein [Gammaproteobacteria bacterium]
MFPALLMLPVAFGANIGPDGTICPDNDKWVPSHYMPVGDGSELVWTEGGCAPKEYEIPQQPSEIPNITVIGQRIPRIPIRIYLPPPFNPLRVIPPLFVVAPHPLPTPKKPETGFKFGICSRPLGQDYSQGRTAEEWEKIQQALRRHDDVVWSEAKTGGSGSWGSWEWNERDAAGLHPSSGDWATLLAGGPVPGVIMTPNPIPSESACQMESITKQQHSAVAADVSAHRANPPQYKLWTYNCKHWAKAIRDAM